MVVVVVIMDMYSIMRCLLLLTRPLEDIAWVPGAHRRENDETNVLMWWIFSVWEILQYAWGTTSKGNYA